MKNHEKNSANEYQYQSTLTRRESLKWLGILSASALIPTIVGCNYANKATTSAAKGHWPTLNLTPITAKGYGQDPNLIIPLESPWPRTLTPEQLTFVAILSDIIVPIDGNVPSASEVQVPDVIDEWVSAPYGGQQNDRVIYLSVLAWLDDESQLRFSKKFVALSQTQQFEIIDDIAYRHSELAPQFQKIAGAFARFRSRVLAAFFCTPQGTKDLGYMGNVPIAGDYPGPTDEAMAHLDKVLNDLGLAL